MVADNPTLNSVFLEAIGETSIADLIATSPESGFNSSCFDSANNYSSLRGCLKSQCVSSGNLATLYGTTLTAKLGTADVERVAPAVLYLLTQQGTCTHDDHGPEHESPGSAAVWGYSFLFVTLINLCSLCGALVFPCIKTKIYKVVLMVMVALAVGTLVGSGLLVLIPEALGIGGHSHGGGGDDHGDDHGDEGEHEDEDDLDYLWKTTTVMGGIYLFFVLERVMRMINNRRENTREKREQDEAAVQGTYTSTFQPHSPENPQSHLKDPSNIPQAAGGAFSNCAFTGDSADLKTNGSSSQNGTAGDLTPLGHEGRRKIAPVAYMIIFGDALHNFIDGLSIGAAFTDSTLLGISVSVAVMCEELPHELGDFAILLNSGMTIRRALCYNFLSSLSCYLGLVIGIVLGENTSANSWIFAIAGGMFLYISLVDMLPEMNSAAETEAGKEFGEVKTFIVQNIGLLVGFGIILILSVYGGNINFE